MILIANNNSFDHCGMYVIMKNVNSWKRRSVLVFLHNSNDIIAFIK